MRGPEGTPQGVRPTINAESQLSGNVSDIGIPSCPTERAQRHSITRDSIDLLGAVHLRQVPVEGSQRQMSRFSRQFHHQTVGKAQRGVRAE